MTFFKRSPTSQLRAQMEGSLQDRALPAREWRGRPLPRVASRSLPSLSLSRWAMGVSDPPAAQTHTEWAYEINLHSERRKGFRPPLCPTCGRYWSDRGRRCESLQFPQGRGNSLSPRGKTKAGPCIHVLLMACRSLGCAGSILGWYEKYSQGRVSSSPHSSKPLPFCCEVPQAVRALRRLEGEPALRGVRS